MAVPEGLQGDGRSHDHEPEVILGTRGGDTLIAGGGPQAIYGDNGRDTIYAGGGHTAAGGHDDSHDDSLGGGETIVDFQPGTDTIDLSALSGGFSFVGVIAEGNASAGERQVGVQAAADGCTVLVNVEGTNVAELEIALIGVSASALEADDFLLA
ncbi:MAG TPA: M10 family metallopeptidase C-terminal domain-containing protein [Rhodospirillales bacterium]|nr:M10 family metallopeptidase C-terminal domain-containing protein [Rhodospirillales bacterium]